MNKKIISGMAFILLSVSILTLAFNIPPIESDPGTIRVPDDYPTIQEAIDAADYGDTILVAAGAYSEAILIDKSLNLVGESIENTTIDGVGTLTWYVVRITGSNVNVSNFAIKYPAYSPGVGIQVDGDYVSVIGNNITNCDIGIRVEARETNIAENTFVENPISVESRGTNCIIIKNDIKGFWMPDQPSVLNTGISLETPAKENTIQENSLESCYNAISIVSDMGSHNVCDNEFLGNCFGIYIENAENNTVSNNEILWGGRGIFLSGSSHNMIRNNFLHTQSSGSIVLVNSNSSTIKENTISNTILTFWAGIDLSHSYGNVVYHNEILNNPIQAEDDGVNSWDNGPSEGGNYWSDYEGEDQNGDGFGDTLTPHYGDLYPLIVPRGPIPVFWPPVVGLEQKSYYCNLLGNMTVSKFYVDRSKTMNFNITGEGYVNLTIPCNLIDGSIKVFVNDAAKLCSLSWNATHNSIYFEHATSKPINVKIEAKFKLFGDLNSDGTVNILDIAAVAIHFGETLDL